MDWQSRCSGQAERAVLGLLYLFRKDPDCAMAFDYFLDHKENMLGQLGDAFALIRKHFGSKCRSVGSRGALRARLINILYFNSHEDRQVRSYLTHQLGPCLLWTLGDCAGEPPPLLAPRVADINAPENAAVRVARGVLADYVREQSIKHRLPQQVVRILSRNRGT